MNLVNNKYTITELEYYIANNKLTILNWACISYYQKLTEAFIDKYKDKVYWNGISYYQKLTEVFIDKYSDRVNWDSVACNQKLSEWFIEKHSDKLNWEYITRFQKLSYSFLEKHLYKFPLYIIECGVNNAHIIKLQDKYKHKYYIDKLAFEIN